MSIKAAANFVFIKVIQVVAAVIVWELTVTALDVDPRIVPAPDAVASMLWAQLISGAIIQAGWITLQETVIGFVIGATLGIVLAVLLSEIDILRKILQPYIVALQAVPKVAVTPLFLIWFGFGMESKIALVVTILFFPVLVNTMAGLASTSEDQIELMRAYGATRWQMLTRLKVYVAMPYVFAAFEVSLVLALTAAVVAELLGSGTLVGLGTLIKIYDARMNSAGMWAVLIVLSLLGVMLHGTVMHASKWLIRWDRKA
ncbi:NitT/TauT family transport system permease protein [Rhizobium sp. NFR07]|uniref:ABC transporter permease n=1 Tax=Rhizobium sp. NFR07 TaxID=1566262 RepID=UPI0008EAC667|nr:ABC transporter permease [Rhizobium sp. NFR07]SFA82759.1 NitT/TauT family transport system permease protein [Rhizobium sp. NFR07]